MKITRFEDIKAWQEGRILTSKIYKITSEGNFSKDFKLRDQIRDASVSIMSNIAEGFDSQSDVGFIQFLVYSRRSSSEVQSHLYVALDQNYIIKKEFEELYTQCNNVKSIISGFIRYLKQK